MSMLTQFWPVCMYDQSLIKFDDNPMPELFSNIHMIHIQTYKCMLQV